MDQSVVDPLVGTWTYRSFQNLPDPNLAFNDLRFGQGELVIDTFTPGGFSGRLNFSPTAGLRLTGASSFGNPVTIRFQGRGEGQGVEDFVYDYVAYLVPIWPNGVNQRPALVGSIVRTEPHAGGAEPGFVGTWFAVRQD